MDSLFETPSETGYKRPVILLIDASGSVRSPYRGSTTIIDEMESIVKNIKAEQFRIIFWNSDKVSEENNKNFPRGLLQIMHVVDKSVIKQPFFFAKSKIVDSSLTFPHLGFQAIPKEWIDDKEPTHVYFITDGQMGYGSCPSSELQSLKTSLKLEIEKLFQKHNNIHLHIVTVEAKNMDFNQLETLNVAAGGDVFNVIQSNQLTKYITEFISYTPNNSQGYHHINTVIPPPGYVPFQKSYFSETKTNEFIRYLHDLIKKTPGEDDLLKIIQCLSSTLKVLTKDKPQKVVESIVQTFCDLFKGTVIDPTMAQFILADTILLESQGKAIVFSAYRSKLRDLYKQAQSLLQQNTKNVLGLTGDFITFPIDDKIVYGHNSLVTETLKIGGSSYPNSSVKINNLVVPALPIITTEECSLINEQCIRQFVRGIISRQYQVDQMGDIVIYIVLGLVLKVVLSDVDEKYTNAYRRLGHIMLRKKRLNTDITELQRLETGELPIPNSGKIETFYGFMDNVARLLNIRCKPMTLWYAMCLALNNPSLITKQLIHCSESISEEYQDIENVNLLIKLKESIKPITVHELSLTDYKCIITLTDCSNEGGYMFKPHISLTNSTCAPVYVVSQHGYEMMMGQQNVLCPICYQSLNVNDFKAVGPKVGQDDIIFADSVRSPFSQGEKKPQIPSQKHNLTMSNSSSKKILVLMKGTVGAGKSTFSRELQNAVEKIGGYCFNEGTDKYCCQGYTTPEACKMVTAELKKLETIENPLVVVIIDTCGDRNNSDVIFDIDFRGWKKIAVLANYNKDRQKQYLSWSLRNVLNRSLHSGTSNYYLNPVSAGVNVCVDVHHKKAIAIFGKKTQKVSYGNTRESVLKDITTAADEYAQFLEQSMPIDKEIEKIMNKII